MRPTTAAENAALLFTRLIVGAVFIYAGLAKWFIWTSGPLPGMEGVMIPLTKLLSIVEPLGGAALILGFLARWASAGLAIIMTGSLYFVYVLFQAGVFTSEKGTGMDYNLLLLAGNLILLVFGPGAWAVDSLRRSASGRK
jgi:putative oxidoreductase